jgi:predicted dehydrogenase
LAAGAMTGFPAVLRGAGEGRIKIGQIGTGHAHASGKMETMRASAEYEVVGIAEPHPERRAGAEKSRAYEGLRWMSVEELLATPGLQAVAVETEVKDLVPMASLAVHAGKHVHLDKPAGESLPAFQALLVAAEEKKVTVQMGYMLRYNPAFALLFQLLKEGALGEVFSIDAVMSKLLSQGERARMLPYTGGSMFELGCHLIDAALYVLGKPEKVTPYGRRVTGTDGYVDNGLAVLEYPRATATIRSAMIEVEGGPRRQFVVCGTKGTFDIRPLEPAAARLALLEPHGDYKKGYQDVRFAKGGGRYDGDFAELAKVIRGEKKLDFTPQHDLAVEETVLQASALPVT